MAASPPLHTVVSSDIRTTYDRTTSLNVIPTLPSPPHSSPTLTQSTSNSHSSSSPPQPSTPPRHSRPRQRYPDLGRVPLHRRGTSKTYERLEDLLREAGYKETRVFTPEGERDGDEKKESRATVRGGINAVAGFLAGLVHSSQTHKPSRSSSEARPDVRPDSLPSFSPPASPLAHLQRRNVPQPKKTAPNQVMNLSTEGLDPGLQTGHQLPTRIQAPVYQNAVQHQSARPGATRASSDFQYENKSTGYRLSLQHQQSYTSLQHPHNQTVIQSPMPVRPNTLLHPNLSFQAPSQAPSRAGAYLRHMTSTPAILPRPSSTPAHQRKVSKKPTIIDDDFDSSEFHGKPGNGEGEDDTMSIINLGTSAHSSYPKIWIENVARAVMFGGSTSNLSLDQRPTRRRHATHSRPQTSHGPRQLALRQTRSSISPAEANRETSSPPSASESRDVDVASLPGGNRTGTRVSDQNNSSTAITPHIYQRSQLAPPDLFAKLERGRSSSSKIEVNTMRVVCRSAPGSRAGSRVRGVSLGEESNFSIFTTGIVGAVSKSKQKDQGSSKTSVPSLARTKAEGDSWAKSHREQEIESNHDSKQKRLIVADMLGYDGDIDARPVTFSEWKSAPKVSGSHAHISALEDHPGDDSDDDDSDDGEPDLAKILGTPKRQHSIKSLRKHLSRPASSKPIVPTTSKISMPSPLSQATPRFPVLDDPESAFCASPISDQQPSRATESLLRAAGLLSSRRSSTSYHDPALPHLAHDGHTAIRGTRDDAGHDRDSMYESDGADDERDKFYLGQTRLNGGESHNSVVHGSGKSHGTLSRVAIPAAWSASASGAAISSDRKL